MKNKLYEKLWKNRQLVFAGLFIVISAVFVSIIRSRMELLRDVHIEPGYIIVVVIIAVLNRFVESLKVRRCMAEVGVNMSAKESFGVAAIANYYNYIITKAGLAVTAVYMKKKHQFKYTKYIGIAGGSIVLKVMTAAILGGLTVVIFANKDKSIIPVYWIYGVLIAGTLSFFFLPRKLSSKNFLYRKISNMLDGWHAIKRNRMLVFLIILFEVTSLFLISLRYYFIFRVFSDQVPFFVCFVMAPVNVVSHFVNIVPQGYGVKEMLLGVTSKYLGYGLDMGVLVAVVDRIIMMALAGVLGPVFSYKLLGKFYFKDEVPQEAEKEYSNVV